MSLRSLETTIILNKINTEIKSALSSRNNDSQRSTCCVRYGKIRGVEKHVYASFIQHEVPRRKINGRENSLTKAPQGGYFICSFREDCVSWGKKKKSVEKQKEEKKPTCIWLTLHLLTQFSVIVILKHHFLDWSSMQKERYKENI